MLFNSFAFAVFLPAVVVAFWAAPHRRRHLVLLAASYVFYAWWDPRFLSLILISTLADFSIGKRLAVTTPEPARKRLLAASLTVNLGLLGIFKYWNFFIESAADLIESAGGQPNLPILSVVLPVGVSFYTFQTLSYTIDVYRKRIGPEPELSRFALFVAFFPQLVAGPIERASKLLPQLRSLPQRTASIEWANAVALIGRGLFRKVVIADGVAPYVDRVYASPGEFGALAVVTAVVAFSLQIYGDFAGYTDIARGTAKLFGVDLMVNFKAPYSATGFSDFWRRWHISLSTWLRDYLYIPLGGNRGTARRTYINLFVTMLLGGLWHGAGWGFLIWGALHGLYLIIERAITGRRQGFQWPAWIVFVIVTITWIPFRAPTWTHAVDVFTGMFGSLDGRQLAIAPAVVLMLGLISRAIDHADVSGTADPVGRLPAPARGAAYGSAIVLAVLLYNPVNVPFIYFQF